jgi:Zn-dependent protease with chaperone function
MFSDLKWNAFLRCLLVALPLCLCVTGAHSADNASASVEDPRQITEYRLSPEKLEQATALYKTRVTMFVLGTVYAVALLLLILFTRLGARFRNWAERMSRRRFVQALVFTGLLFATLDLLSLPIEIYRQHLALAYGLSVQGWGSWLADWFKAELLTITLAIFVVWGLYALIRHSPKRWWLFAWLAAIPFVLLIVFAEPMIIAPLFNKFEPLAQRQPQLVPELEKVMQRGGLTIERSRMFEMQASAKQTTYNAYVTGIGASKRVVVWDNTSRELGVDEVLYIFGHEQGHYVLHHIWIMLGTTIGALLVALFIIHVCIGAVLQRWGARWQIRDFADWASLPALLLVFSLLSFVSQPISAAFSRHFEHQADIYGLEVIHGLVPDSSQVAARAFQHLGEKGLAYPHPNALYVLWAYDHPTIAERLRFAASYRPWDEGREPKYVR